MQPNTPERQARRVEFAILLFASIVSGAGLVFFGLNALIADPVWELPTIGMAATFLICLGYLHEAWNAIRQTERGP